MNRDMPLRPPVLPYRHLRRAIDRLRRSPGGGALGRHGERGFTLLELLVVLVILGLLIGLVGPAVIRQLGNAKEKIAQQSIQRISTVLDMYKLDVGSYPTTEQGLKALVEPPSSTPSWHGPYVEKDKLPEDPWNHAYLYRLPSSRSGHDYDLCSPGPNAQNGTAEKSSEICN